MMLTCECMCGAGTVKTLLVDDSQVVANLMVVICTKIGITNYDEYGLVSTTTHLSYIYGLH